MTIRSFLIIILACVLSSCAKQQYIYVADVDTDYIKVNRYAAKDDDHIVEMIAPYKAKLDVEMNEVLGVVAEEMVKHKPNSNLGNWFGDILAAVAEMETGMSVDFAIQNYGGLRVPSVAAGELKVGGVYELMPFDNTLITMKLSGAVTKQLIDRIADYGGWPISDGLSFRIAGSKAEDIMIGGEAFDINKTYVVALPDYVANGGDSCTFLKDQTQYDTGKYIRELVIQYLRNQGDEPISAPTTQRIK